MNQRQQKNSNIRVSNFELLRISAMMLVLVVHADFLSISNPKTEDIIDSPILSFFRFFVESCSIVCVNVFVLISGWFSIKPKVERFCNFFFQVVFFSVLLYFPFGSYHKSPGEWITIVLGFQYWFVRAYIILYLLSPVLNSFVNTANRKQLLLFILLFYLVQTIYGWYLGKAAWFNKGYSPLSFVGLYFIGRYLNIYKPFNCSPLKWGWFYLISVFFISILAFYGVKKGFDVIPVLYAYSCPIVIIASICFFMFFAEMKLKANRVINWIAISSFAVYLFHYHECILHKFYTDIISNWFKSEPIGTFALYTIGWIVVIFMISIFIDKIRIVLWNATLKVFHFSVKYINGIR